MKSIVLLLVAILFIGCEAKLESSGEQPPVNKSDGVGPFPLILSVDNVDIENEFDVPINQSEGKVEFILPAQGKINWMKFESSALQTSGCDASAVVVNEYWTSQPDQPARSIVKGQYFSSRPELEGKLVLGLTNLQGCTSVSYKLKVRLISSDDPKVFSSSAVTCFGIPYGHKLDIFQGTRDANNTRPGYMMHGFPEHRTLDGPYSLTSDLALTDVRSFFLNKRTDIDLTAPKGANERLIITYLRGGSNPELFLGGGRYVSLKCVVH